MKKTRRKGGSERGYGNDRSKNKHEIYIYVYIEREVHIRPIE